MADQVPNPYKAAIGRALGTVKSQAGEVATALDGAKKAFAANAWTGGSSGAFGTDLTGNGTTAKNGADGCVNELQALYDKEPDKVDSDAWQIHWRNL